MPITEELKTATELEAAGAPRALAQLLARKLEESAAAGRQASLDAFAAEMRTLRMEMDARFDSLTAEMKLLHAEMRAELHQSLRSSQAVVLSAIGIATALLALITHYWH